MYAQLACAVSAVLSTTTCIASTFWSVWAISGPESDSILGAIWAWKGLWASCTQSGGGQYNCIEQTSLLLQDPYMNALQAMMCLGICLSMIAFIMLLFGMECSKFMDDNLNAKRKVMRICGSLFLTTAVLTLASAAWYTSVIINDFFSFKVQDNVIIYEMGPTLFVVYAGAFLSLVTSALCFCLPGPQPDDNEYGKSNYSNSIPTCNRYWKSEDYDKTVTMQYV